MLPRLLGGQGTPVTSDNHWTFQEYNKEIYFLWLICATAPNSTIWNDSLDLQVCRGLQYVVSIYLFLTHRVPSLGRSHLL